MSKQLLILILSLLMLVVIVVAFHLPIGAWLRRFLAWTDQLGAWGPLLLMVLFILGSVLLVLPGFILTVGAGFLYGVPLGFLIVWISNTLGACAAFAVGRTIARDWVARRVARHEKFASLDEAIGEQGFRIVLLTRLSPAFPFGFLNYAFSVSRVSFRPYALASCLGLIPGVLVFVYIGASLRPLATAIAAIEDPTPAPIAHQVFFWFGLASTIVLAVVLTHIAREALAGTSHGRNDPPASSDRS